MRLEIDAERCTGHGRCYSLEPDFFDSDHDGHAVVVRADVPPERERDAERARVNCPERAITLSA